jgi:hypothetical protein
MSYHKGYEAFIRRFKKRFPEPEFRWEDACHDSEWSGDRSHHGYRICRGEVAVCHISARINFGLGLDVSSKFLNPKRDPEQQKYDMDCRDGVHTCSIYRRPLRVCFANRHNMRMWLQNKPKLAKLGASLSKQIFENFTKTS